MAPVVMLTTAIGVAITAFLLHRNVNLPKNVFDMQPAEASSSETMTAIAYDKHGRDVLYLQNNYPRPEPRPNQILIRVMASSLNPCDYKIRRNAGIEWVMARLFPKPKIPAADVAGVVVGIGKDVSKFQVGDRVAAMMPIMGSRWGAAAEFAAVNEDLVAKIADHVEYASAASLPLVAMTVIQGLDNLKKGTKKEDISAETGSTPKKILIHAGSGGVGTFAIQYAKKVLGMYVATTASAAKADFLKELGADMVIDYKSEKFEDRVRDFDVVLDSVSWAYEGRTLGKNKRVLAPTGHYINIMSSDWEFNRYEKGNGLLTPYNYLFHKLMNLFTSGSVPSYDVVVAQPDGKQTQMVMDLLGNSTIRAVIDHEYNLASAPQAYEYLEQGHVTGKVVLNHNMDK